MTVANRMIWKGYLAIQFKGRLPVKAVYSWLTRPASLASRSQIHSTEYTTAGVIMGIIRNALKTPETRSLLIKYVVITAKNRSSTTVPVIAISTNTAVFRIMVRVLGSRKIFS